MSEPEHDTRQPTSAWLDATERSCNLTRSQFLMWLGQRLEPQAPIYNMVFAWRLRGKLDTARLCAAFHQLISQCDTLRSVLTERDGVPRLEVHDRIDYDFELVKLTADTLDEWIDTRKVHRFEPGCPLFDSALLELDDDDHVLYLNQHHIVTDASSIAVLLERLSLNYTGQAGNLPLFADYAARERAQRDGKRYQRAHAYWMQALETPPQRLSFYGESRANQSRTRRRRHQAGRSRTDALRAIAAQDGVHMFNDELSLFRVTATVVLAFLHRVTAARRIALGAPVHNRTTPTDRATPGLYTEVFPLIVDFEDSETFTSLLDKVGKAITGLFANALPGISSPQTNTSYDVLLNFLFMRMPELPGLDTRSDWIHSGFGDSAHKLRLQVHDFDDSGDLTFDFDFNRGAFSTANEQLAIDQFFALTDAFISDRGAAIAGADISRETDNRRQLVVFNDTSADMPATTVVELFAARVRAAADAIAVRDGDVALSYSEVDGQSDHLALSLATGGLGPGQVAALLLPRSPQAVVTILAVLKTGAAYLPLDTRHPAARLKAIVADVNASELGMQTVIGRGERPAWLEAGISWTDIDTAPAPSESVSLQAPRPGDLAYLIYTSGSTGTPKGVQIEHRSLANYVNWARDRYCGTPSTPRAFALHTSLAVDLTITSIFVPLASGGTVVVYADQSENDLPVIRVFKEDRVDVLKLTPAHLALIREVGGSAQRISTLILGGEDLKSGLVRAIGRQFPDTLAIYNEYGPTEGTVGCMIHRFDAAADSGASVSIGQPIANARIYLLDAHARPVPTGLVGEICIGGPGVARGYLNRPALNAERFVDTAVGGRLYRTGDLGRWDTSGRLHYLGRGDDQVKVRGVRIELAEVATALQANDAVDDAIAVVSGGAAERELHFCARCGNPSNYPGIVFDDNNVCSMCLSFDLFRDQAMAYFGTMDDLHAIAAEARAAATGEHDCIVLLSGGKDSTYMIHQVAALGLRPLALTLDNGYIAEGALENAARTVKTLGIDHIVAHTPQMNAIFADSLARYSNVCHGCFKTIYTFALKEARDRNIGYVFTGLSRGQIFETRLNDLFRHRIFDVGAIEQAIIEARKVYHRVDDAVSKALDFNLFDNDAIFSEVRFVDFYRYCDIDLDEVYRFLSTRAPWVRPSDTGRSTNCLINDAGIFVHRKERGYHNYALPYSWDVRLGHKTRDAALYELDDEIDIGRVREILDEVGYEEKSARGNTRLVVYYTGAGASAAELRTELAERLPQEMLPDAFVHVDKWPLTPTGKIDRAALPAPADRPAAEAEFVAPSNDVEKRLAAIWSELLDVSRIGIDDNFFDIGGVSLAAIQALARIRDAFGIELPIRSFFRSPTIAAIATEIEEQIVAEVEALPEAEVQRLLNESRE